MHQIIEANISEIKKLFKEHNVSKAFVFGSICTENFNENNDIDFIVKFKQRYFDDYVDNFFSLEEKLQTLLQRNIDILTEENLKNPFFIKVVNKTKTPIYE